MNSHAKIRFLHIPKTAGTSFSNCLKRIYKASRFKNNAFVFLGHLHEDLVRYRKLDESQRAKLVLVSGHVPLVTGVPEIDALPTITFLRDPVERVKSLFQHVSEGKIKSLDPTLDIDTLLERNIWPDNLQTRTLLGAGNYELPDLDEAAIVALAMDVLENRLAGFGLTEQFDDSLLLFKHALGWKPYPVYTRLNEKSRSRALQFSDGQIRRIREKNAIDIRLYEAASKVFRSRLAKHAGAMETLRRGFSIRQKAYAPVLGIYRLYHKGWILWAGRRRPAAD